MGRVAKKVSASATKEVEESPTITQSRTRRTPKPNPKYNSETIIAPPRIDAEDNDLSDSEDGDTPAETKAFKSVKKASETSVSLKGNKTLAKGRGGFAKKQKLEYDEDLTDDADEKIPEEDKVAPTTRATRSGKGGAEAKDTMKVGDDSVAIVDVSSIISKAPDSPKNTRGGTRKRAVPEESAKEDLAKKKKEDEKPSLITARKSYMPSPPAAKKAEVKEKVEVKKEEFDEKPSLDAIRSTGNTRSRRNAGAVIDSPQAEVVEKKPKVDAVKVEAVKTELRKLPLVRRSDQIVKVVEKSPMTLPTKPMNTVTTVTAASGPRPIPRLLNTMMTPKPAKQSPNVKLAGDGTDKKVFSIDLTDDSIKEKKTIISPVKPSPVRAQIAAKENVAINKPQPAALLKNKLESELQRMKASANVFRRQQMMPQVRQSMPNQNTASNVVNVGARRVTKFESWYVIDVKNLEPAPFRHTHTHSLISLGNNIKDLQLPSSKWDYKVTLQKKLPRQENNNDEEVYTGEVSDKTLETEKANYEPSSILFKRTHRETNKVSIDRSLMLKQNIFTITMNGKQCKLVGAPDDIKSNEDLEYLISIIDSSNLDHPCVELVTNHDNIITVS